MKASKPLTESRKAANRAVSDKYMILPETTNPYFMLLWEKLVDEAEAAAEQTAAPAPTPAHGTTECCKNHGTPLNGDGACFWCDVADGKIPEPSGPNKPTFSFSKEWCEKAAKAEEGYDVLAGRAVPGATVSPEPCANCARLNAAVLRYEEREAAVCPEDTPFEEVIRTQAATISRLREAVKTLKAIHREFYLGSHVSAYNRLESWIAETERALAATGAQPTLCDCCGEKPATKIYGTTQLLCADCHDAASQPQGSVIGLLKSIHGMCVDEEPHKDIADRLWEAVERLEDAAQPQGEKA
jgi:hypothetical protein